MILKHSTLDSQLCLLGGLSASEQRELAHLLAQVPEPGRASALADRLPVLSPQLVERCLWSLESPPSRWKRASIARSLERDLVAYARQPRSVDIAQRTVRRFLRGRATSRRPRRESASSTAERSSRSSGLTQGVATSVVDGLAAWLDKDLAVMRFRCAGPEELRSSARARRHASNGGISICDQFPTNQSPPDILIELEPAQGGRPVDEVLRDAREHVWASL